MAYFLAIDAGGTKTDFVLASETQILARTRTGTIKRMRTDARTALSNLTAALQTLSEQTGIAISSISQTCIGTAGETVPLVTDFLRTEISARVPGGLLLLGDVEIALDAAFPGAPGVIVIAGTGSNVAGRGGDAIVQRAGGWGPVLADQGSGNRIGQEAIRAALLAYDERGANPLLDAVLAFWELTSLDELVEVGNRQPSPDFSKLTPTVVHCAEQGDAVALRVLHREADELAYLIRLVLRRIGRAPDGTTPRLAFTGSVLQNVPIVRNALLASVCSEFPGTSVLEGSIDPVLGALWRARSAFFRA
jgi:glucosamine kinase